MSSDTSLFPHLVSSLPSHMDWVGIKRVYGTEDGRCENGGAREWGDRAAWKKARWIYRVEQQIVNGSATPVADALKLCGVKSSTQLRGQKIPNPKYVELMSKIQQWQQEPARTHILNNAAGASWCVLPGGGASWCVFPCRQYCSVAVVGCDTVLLHAH